MSTSAGENVSISTIPKYSCSKLLRGRENFVGQVKDTMSEQNYVCAILLGSGDMVVYPAKGDIAGLVKAEVAATEADLGIVFKETTAEGVDYYKRTNPTVSRKKILPMVKDALNKANVK